MEKTYNYQLKNKNMEVRHCLERGSEIQFAFKMIKNILAPINSLLQDFKHKQVLTQQEFLDSVLWNKISKMETHSLKNSKSLEQLTKP